MPDARDCPFIPADARVLAREILAAQDAGREMPLLTARFPGFGLEEGRAVAAELRRLRLAAGAETAGIKIGFTNPGLWPTFGVSAPIWGCMYDRSVVRLPDSAGRFSLAQLVSPRIEPEIVFRFREAPPPDPSPADLLRCIDQVAHGFEIVDCPFAGWRFEAADAIATGAFHAALLLGEPQPLDASDGAWIERLIAFGIELRCDGEVRDRGRGANVLGGPWRAVAALVCALAAQAGSPRIGAGDWVSTGCLTAALPVAAGQHWSTRLDGLPLPGLDVAFV
jgi:2-keto-4-pentenoate hydratase